MVELGAAEAEHAAPPWFSQADEERSRERNREEHKARARALWAQGNKAAAMECYQKAVDIQPAHAKQFVEVGAADWWAPGKSGASMFVALQHGAPLMAKPPHAPACPPALSRLQALKQRNIPYIVAPYEADAQASGRLGEGIAQLLPCSQLHSWCVVSCMQRRCMPPAPPALQMAYLALNNLVDAVLTEDSDLLCYGCPTVGQGCLCPFAAMAAPCGWAPLVVPPAAYRQHQVTGASAAR